MGSLALAEGKSQRSNHLIEDHLALRRRDEDDQELHRLLGEHHPDHLHLEGKEQDHQSPVGQDPGPGPGHPTPDPPQDPCPGPVLTLQFKGQFLPGLVVGLHPCQDKVEVVAAAALEAFLAQGQPQKLRREEVHLHHKAKANVLHLEGQCLRGDLAWVSPELCQDQLKALVASLAGVPRVVLNLLVAVE